MAAFMTSSSSAGWRGTAAAAFMYVYARSPTGYVQHGEEKGREGVFRRMNCCM
jgi:hypothetical protein